MPSAGAELTDRGTHGQVAAGNEVTMNYRIGHLRALGLACLLAGCNGGGDDTSSESTGAATVDSSETGTAASTTSDDTTGPATPTSTTMTTVDDTGPTPTTGDDTTGPEPTTGDETGGSQQCNPSAQDCPEGSKCTAFAEPGMPAWSANKCVPTIEGAPLIGEPCEVMGENEFSGIDNCAAGGICLFVDAELKNGFCVEFCDPDVGECAGNDQVCIPANGGVLPICVDSCDPLIQDCPAGGGCYGDPSGPPFVCFFEDPVGGGMDGDPCSFSNACLKGLSCTDAAVLEGCNTPEGGCCSPYCELDGMNQCTDPEECTAFFPMEYPGYENVGVCTLPG